MREYLPRALFHRIRFIRCIGIWSGWEKSIRAEAPDSGAFGPFVAVSDTCGATTLKGWRFGVDVKAAVIGVAAASNWLIAGTPTIASIVRKTDTEE